MKVWVRAVLCLQVRLTKKHGKPSARKHKKEQAFSANPPRLLPRGQSTPATKSPTVLWITGLFLQAFSLAGLMLAVVGAFS